MAKKNEKRDPIRIPKDHVELQNEFFEFCPPESCCHIYLVRSENKDKAIEKFLKWQKENLAPEIRWPEEVIREKDNWMINLSAVIIE